MTASSREKILQAVASVDMIPELVPGLVPGLLSGLRR